MSAALVLALLAVLVAPQAHDDALTEARGWLAQNDAERAVQVLEAARATRAHDVELERALAQALERFVDGGGAFLALHDARDAWDRALALEPSDLATQRAAIAVRLRLGEHDAALARAEQAIGAAWLEHGSTAPELLELACRARLGALPPREGSLPDARRAALGAAWSALQHARELAPASTELVRLCAALLEAEGLRAQAGELLVAGIEHQPSASELHRALVDLYLHEGLEERLSALYGRWSANGTNATLAWWTGYAARLGGDLAQRERRFGEALEAYARADEWMAVAGTLEPGFRANAETVRFQAQVSAGWCELESGALDAAGERLLRLMRASPARRAEPDGLARTLMQAVAALGERRASANDFERAAAELRALLAALPADASASELGNLWNNLGFLLREYATQLEAGKIEGLDERESRARATFRESWQAYQRALALCPNDVRVLNDAALVQVYHLRDNLAEAEAELERALALGQEQLAALGEAPDERARFPLAQALGDAYTNLGYLAYHIYRQPARAREAFAHALACDSGERSALQAYLDALDGKRGPVPESDRGAFVSAPQRSPRERGEPAWESSLVEARTRARAEQRPLLVYHRGSALSLAVPALDELVTRPEFVRATQGCVLLLSDSKRESFVDRRHDGRRVSCPRFGGLTCGEHQAACAEVVAWLEELRGVLCGADEEGLWFLRPTADTPELVRDLAVLEGLAGAAQGLAGEPFEAIEASLGGQDGGSE
ncbi:MAG: hypothetical protein EXS08_16715, partial [Planctomycetes bacterium]|nr:hypothetical protein [Planctomycetota bacterium]